MYRPDDLTEWVTAQREAQAADGLTLIRLLALADADNSSSKAMLVLNCANL